MKENLFEFPVSETTNFCETCHKVLCDIDRKQTETLFDVPKNIWKKKKKQLLTTLSAGRPPKLRRARSESPAIRGGLPRPSSIPPVVPGACAPSPSLDPPSPPPPPPPASAQRPSPETLQPFSLLPQALSSIDSADVVPVSSLAHSTLTGYDFLLLTNPGASQFYPDDCEHLFLPVGGDLGIKIADKLCVMEKQNSCMDL